MPAQDAFHHQAKNALKNDDWDVTHDPFSFRIGREPFHIDMGAEKIIGAEKHGRKIAVGVKSFLGASFAADFHTAVGQFINYRSALRREGPNRVLYLAVTEHIYSRFFIGRFAELVVKDEGLRLIVFDINKEEIVEWIE